MTLFEMLSTKKFTLSGNIDERYFKLNDDGTYSATPLFMHNVARDVANDIKTIIIGTDDENYVTHSNNKGAGYDVNDTWAKHEHDAAWQTKYKTQIAEEAAMWKDYQKSHPDEFEQNQPTIATGDIPTTRFFSAYHPDFSGMSNAELMSMYKEATELSKKYGEDLRDTLPLRPGNLNSKEEFKETHRKIREANRIKVGLPEDTFVTPKIHKDDRASLIRSNSKAYKAIANADGKMFDTYVDGLVAHLTSSTPEAYQKEWEELYTNIEDVCDNLERGGRGTKLVVSRSNAKDAMNISIYTSNKSDEGDRKRLVNISKVEPGDAFYTVRFFVVSNGRRPVYQVATKTDLRRVLETLIEILEYNDMNEYVDCIQNAIDAIL